MGHDLSWTGSAFGLSIRSSFALPGFHRGGALASGRRLDLALRPPTSSRPATDATRIYEWRDPTGMPVLAIDSAPPGYRFYVEGVGAYELDSSGTHASCTPDPKSGWLWQRYLLGQVLPFAALLQGLEVFHASAVALGGGAVCFAGPSGAGKSTLAINLHLAGAGILTDDVVAVELVRGRAVVHPGPGAVKIRRAALDLVSPDRASLGHLVSSDHHELRYEVAVEERPLPIRTFCLLHPQAGLERPVIEELPGEPWPLLASTFNLLVDDADRLRAQLDVCQTIARQARMLRVRIPQRPGASVAEALAAGLAAPAVA
jgi:hypothetical protein